MSLKQKAKAIVAERRRKEQEHIKATQWRKLASERERAAIIASISEEIHVPDPVAGKDGRDAPTLSEILDALESRLPDPVEPINVTQGVQTEDIESVVQSMLDAQLPEIQKEDKPKVEVIREEIDLEQLGDYVTKEDLDKALRRVQDAITANQVGGSGGNLINDTPIVNVTEASGTVTITEEELDETKINVILVKAAGSTITLPDADITKVVWVQKGFVGAGTYTVV